MTISQNGVSVVGQLSIPGPFNITSDGVWAVQSILLSVDTVDEQYSGKAVIQTSGSALSASAIITSQNFTLTVSSTQGVAFQLLDMGVTVTSVTFISNIDAGSDSQPGWDPELDIQGQLTLPQQLGGLVVDISGQNYIAVNSNGVSLTGATITLPGQQTFDALGLLEVETENVSLTIDTSQPSQQVVELQGTFTVPDLNNVTIDLSGDQFIGFEVTGSSIAFAMDAQFSIASLPIWGSWSFQNVVVNAVKPYDGAGSASGTASLQTPGSAIQLAHTFADGRDQTEGLAAGSGIQFTLLGTNVAISQLVFALNIDPNSDGWDPQVGVQGSVTLPPALGNAVVSVTAPNELVVNSTGISLTGGAIVIPR